MDEQVYTILNVDDNEAERYAVSCILREAGFNVIEAKNGNEAIRMAKENPDLILLDINLPDINGLEVCKKIKSNPGLSNIPILILSATSKTPSSIVKGLYTGADGFLTQPVDPEVLIAWVKALLRLKKAEVEARERLLEWEETFNAIVSPIFLLDKRGKIINFNNSAGILFNTKGKNVVGMHINELIKESNFPDKALWKELKSKEKSQLSVEFRHNERYFTLTVTRIDDKEGSPKRYLYILFDDTERKSLERRLYQAQRLESIGRLTAGIAHDFNNILTVIIGYTDMLLLTIAENDNKRTIIEEINRAGKKASDLVQGLLTFSRKQHTEPTIQNINEIVKEMTKLLEKVIGEDIELKLHLDEKLVNVYIDRNQFEQVIMNLVVNARDAMPYGGKLIIETKNVVLDDDYVERHKETVIKKGEYTMLSITDTGVGMDDETMPHIFEPFFTTKADGRGTGLGLSIVYGIVKKSGGYIWVYSEPQKGTTFKIYIPRAEVKKELKEKKEKGSKELPIGNNEVILVVEDDEQIRKLINTNLSELGYRVVTASTPKGAIEICKTRKDIDLLITDMILPEKSGAELYRELKRLEGDIPVLYISGYTDKVIIDRGIKRESFNFLQKPFTPLQLAKKVAEILKR